MTSQTNCVTFWKGGLHPSPRPDSCLIGSGAVSKIYSLYDTSLRLKGQKGLTLPMVERWTEFLPSVDVAGGISPARTNSKESRSFRIGS